MEGTELLIAIDIVYTIWKLMTLFLEAETIVLKTFLVIRLPPCLFRRMSASMSLSNNHPVLFNILCDSVMKDTL